MYSVSVSRQKLEAPLDYLPSWLPPAVEGSKMAPSPPQDLSQAFSQQICHAVCVVLVRVNCPKIELDSMKFRWIESKSISNNCSQISLLCAALCMACQCQERFNLQASPSILTKFYPFSNTDHKDFITFLSCGLPTVSRQSQPFNGYSQAKAFCS